MGQEMVKEPKRFKAIHLVFDTEFRFSEKDAPPWLTSENTVPGSTMDNRWFWERYILTLSVSESVETDFHIIARES